MKGPVNYAPTQIALVELSRNALAGLVAAPSVYCGIQNASRPARPLLHWYIAAPALESYTRWNVLPPEMVNDTATVTVNVADPGSYPLNINGITIRVDWAGGTTAGLAAAIADAVNDIGEPVTAELGVPSNAVFLAATYSSGLRGVYSPEASLTVTPTGDQVCATYYRVEAESLWSADAISQEMRQERSGHAFDILQRVNGYLKMGAGKSIMRDACIYTAGATGRFTDLTGLEPGGALRESRGVANFNVRQTAWMSEVVIDTIENVKGTLNLQLADGSIQTTTFEAP